MASSLKPATLKKPMSTLDKVVPKSSRYDHIQSTVSSGPNVLRAKDVTTRQIVQQRDEIFARISAQELFQLIAHVDVHPKESVNNPISSASHTGGPRIVTIDSEDTGPGIPSHQAADPFILLDVRQNESYSRFHIMDSMNMPKNIYLTQDRVPNELFAIKRQKSPPKLIIIDESTGGVFKEKEAIEVATRLVQQGYMNVHVLTGGLTTFAVSFGDLLQGPEAESFSQKCASDAAGPTRPAQKYASRLNTQESASRSRLDTADCNSSRGYKFSNTSRFK